MDYASLFRYLDPVKTTMNPARSPAFATHTPTPWHVATNPGGPEDQPAFPSIRDSSGALHGQDIIAMPLGDSETVKANAAFIVRACNSHAQLVAALDLADMVVEYANLMSCCRSVREATEAKLYSKLASAIVEYREARNQARETISKSPASATLDASFFTEDPDGRPYQHDPEKVLAAKLALAEANGPVSDATARAYVNAYPTLPRCGLEVEGALAAADRLGPESRYSPLAILADVVHKMRANERQLLASLEATADKLERISASARGDNGHSENTLNVLAQARAALQAANA